MSPDFAIELGMEALWVAVLLAVPKLGTLVLTLFFGAPWMLNVLLDFTRQLFLNVPNWVS